MPVYGITPNLPLTMNPTDGQYMMLKTFKEAIKQNFKNLLLTSPGERMMDINFGVGIYRFLFEQREEGKSALRAKIQKQANIYMPYIKLIDVKYPPDIEELYPEEVLQVRIIYEITPLGTSDLIDLNIAQQNYLIYMRK